MVRRFSRRVGLIVALAVTFVAGNAWSAAPFNDVSQSSNHFNNINAIRDAGITLGCNQDGTNYCPSDFVRRDQMASFLARAMGVSSGSTKNFPKANGRSATQAYCALAAANPGSFSAAACRPSVALVESTDDAGRAIDMAIGSDGLPLISYVSGPNNEVKVGHCSNPQCSAMTSNTLNTAVTGSYTSIAIAPDGRPTVAYVIGTTLQIAFCRDLLCGSGFDFQNFLGISGNGHGIAYGAAGTPVVALTFSDFSSTVGVFVCSHPQCQTSNAIHLASPGDNIDLAIGADGKPVVSYFDTADGAIKLYKCSRVNCFQNEELASLTTIDANNVDGNTSLAIAVDGNPLVSYSASDGTQLRVARCTTANCSAATLTTLLAGTSAADTSIAIGTDGLPVIAFHTATPGDLRLAKCVDGACTAATSVVLDGAAITGVGPSLAVGLDGVPVVAYRQLTGQDLKVGRPPLS